MGHVSVPVWERALAQARTWPLQSVTVEVRAGETGSGRVTVHSGRWGTAPVYAVARNDGLYGDWDPSRLYPLLDDDCLDPLRAASFLGWFDMPYSRHTLFRDMWLLSAGTCATWPTRATGAGADSEGALTVGYPSAVPMPHVGRLLPGAQVPEAFWSVLSASLRRWLGPGGAAHEGRAAVELSGGLDSGVVAAAAATLAPGALRSYGLTMPDADATGQRARREEIVSGYGLVDNCRALDADPPLLPGGDRARARGVVPWEECYYEALSALRTRAAADGAGVLLTGFGGDELCMTHPEDAPRPGDPRPPSPADDLPVHLTDEAAEALRAAVQDTAAFDPAPHWYAAESAVQTVALGAAAYLRYGLWPVHPLCTPELVRLCRRLPARWRRGRTVQRQLLDQLGCPRTARPYGEDDFSPAMISALRGPSRPTLTALFTDPLLAEVNLVDRDALVDGYRRWASGAPGDEVPFYAAAVLELALRSVLAAREEGSP